MIHNEKFRRQYAPNDKFIVVMADTGGEHSYTYAHAAICEKLCKSHNIPFKMIRSKDGFHTKAWPNIYAPQIRKQGEKYKPTMVQLGTKSCTDKLKIGPIYKFLDEWINDEYGYNFPVRTTRGCGKRALRKYAEEYGDIEVLIGFAKGEEKRSEKSLKLEATQKKGTEWTKHLSRKFPLLDHGMTRSDCQAYLKEMGFGHVMPSNCVLCPYMSEPELLWLYRTKPDMFDVWVSIEEEKLKRYAGAPKNYGVYCNKKTLVDKINIAIEKYDHMTDDELWEHKKNHGCPTNVF
jgi:hypothetical protein